MGRILIALLFLIGLSGCAIGQKFMDGYNGHMEESNSKYERSNNDELYRSPAYCTASPAGYNNGLGDVYNVNCN